MFIVIKLLISEIFSKLTRVSKINNNLRRNKENLLFRISILIKEIEKENFIFNSTYFLYKKRNPNLFKIVMFF